MAPIWRSSVGVEGARLGGLGGPAGDAHRPSRDERGGDEWSGVAEVRLDGHVAQGDRSGQDGPRVLVRLEHLNPRVAQRLAGHVDVGHARERRADVPHREAPGQARGDKEQARDELGRRGGVDLDLGRDLRGRRDGEGERAGSRVVDGGAEGAERVDHGPHGPAARGEVPVEVHGGVGEEHERRGETHDRSREPAVDEPAAPQARGRRHRPVVALVVHLHAEAAQRVDHQA